MVRDFVPALRHGLLLVAVVLGGCVSVGENPVEIESFDAETEALPDPEEAKSGFRLGGLIGKKKTKPAAGEKPDQPSHSPSPKPRKIPIGTIHMVHGQGGFVLIESVQMTKIPHDAELMTYSEQGKPTGKLRISPESKGNFRVADILKGSPQANDRVMLFGLEGPDGSLTFGSDPGSGAEEVLE